MFERMKKVVNHPGAVFVCKTVFYLMILVGLLWFYGFNNPNDGGFIYEEF